MILHKFQPTSIQAVDACASPAQANLGLHPGLHVALVLGSVVSLGFVFFRERFLL